MELTFKFPGARYKKANIGDRQPQKATAAAEITEIQQSLVKHFGDIKDPRVERTKKHQP